MATPKVTLLGVHPASVLLFVCYGFGLHLLAQVEDQPMWSPVETQQTQDEEELAAATGLGGRARRLGDPAERARKTVSARIRVALDKIAASDPDLAHHLRDNLHLGTHCAYAPTKPIAWTLTNATTGTTGPPGGS